jgi:hypothetical protein
MHDREIDPGKTVHKNSIRSQQGVEFFDVVVTLLSVDV